ncbi:GNAT family N-acetyltransferase [Pelomonas sp. SE-A7]|uniref:GNAT family N-acetyltransferase n=1 Tax=Pelomonas sp. SE-A7 TaxID=3054953 RepID=UPI00259CFB44|nr:GNAT family N-acetyltransferase [Pelomonas sp. SE-A7]MDM4766048.1 GNAT family N-acetyltransferase [Pelomonas sp. SE-A7]
MRWTCVRLDELPARELYEVLKLRAEVFVVEQRCMYLDPDGADLEAWHLLGRADDGALAAYARLLSGPRIGRVLTSPAARGSGQGRALMGQALSHCERLWPGSAVELSAQAHLQRFYASLGFEPTSGVYDEDGIPHIDMRRPAASQDRSS